MAGTRMPKLYILVHSFINATFTAIAYTPEQALELMANYAKQVVNDNKVHPPILQDLITVINSSYPDIDRFAAHYYMLQDNILEARALFGMSALDERDARKYGNDTFRFASPYLRYVNIRESLNRIISGRKSKPFHSEVKDFPEHYEMLKYEPKGRRNEARKLYHEACRKDMMKFSKDELLKAAKRVGAEVNDRMNKEQICKAINDIYFESEHLYTQK